MASAKRQLLDANGDPVSTKLLKQEIAAPEIGGIRGTQWDTIAPGLTPARLATVLCSAEDGDHRDYLTLAEEMEERELHYISVLGTRKRALSGIPHHIEAASDDAADQKIADAVRDMCESPILPDLLDHMADGIGKGYAVSEILWETSASEWRPKAFLDRDPRHFTFDMVTRRELRLVDPASPDGVPLAPFKFVAHVPRLKSGLPVRGGLAKPAAWAFIFKHYTLKDWAAFCELFGMPIRIGKYGAQATEEDRRRLLNAVRNIGTDAACIVPETMTIEFAEVKGGSAAGTAPVFGSFCDFLDKQISKLVLGQTMTSDSGSSMAQAKVHENVRLDILASDARQLSTTVNRDVIRPFVDLNFGPQKRYPQFRLPVAEPEDLTALANQVSTLVKTGLRVSEDEIRDRFGWDDPEEGEIVLGPNGREAYTREPDPEGDLEDPTDPADAAPDDAGDETPPKAANARRRKSPAKPRRARAKKAGKKAKAACCAPRGKARNSMATEAALDDLRADALKDWERQVDPLLKPIRDLVDGCNSYDQFLAGLPKALAKMDSSAFVATLAASMAIARGLGDVGVANV